MSGSQRETEADPSKKFVRVGIWATVAYLLVAFVYAIFVWRNLLDLDPSEFATFVAGVFSPLAFLWLVLGFFQQGQELRQSSKALWLQGEELKNSVEQQSKLVDVSREQLDFERERITAQMAEGRVRAQPNLKIDGGGSMTGGPTSMLMSFWILNRGPSCNDCEVSWKDKVVMREPLMETSKKRDFNVEIHASEDEGDAPLTVTYTDGLGNAGTFIQPAKVVQQGDRKYLTLAS